MSDPTSRKAIHQAADDRIALYDALLSLKTREEFDAFLSDLCTPSELRAFAERWAVARLLHEQGKSYREIAAEAGASPTTVVRVARFLKDMPHQGYSLVLARQKDALKKKKA
jgi:TrpR-related protein YerC/YecD